MRAHMIRIAPAYSETNLVSLLAVVLRRKPIIAIIDHDGRLAHDADI